MLQGDCAREHTDTEEEAFGRAESQNNNNNAEGVLWIGRVSICSYNKHSAGCCLRVPGISIVREKRACRLSGISHVTRLPAATQAQAQVPRGTQQTTTDLLQPSCRVI